MSKSLLPQSCNECSKQVYNGEALFMCVLLKKLMTVSQYVISRHPQCPLQDTTELLEDIKKLLKKPYKVIYNYSKGFIVTLHEQEVYVSRKFANQFENEEDARSSMLMEFAQQLSKEEKVNET